MCAATRKPLNNSWTGVVPPKYTASEVPYAYAYGVDIPNTKEWAMSFLRELKKKRNQEKLLPLTRR
jgi:hypothetical protein